MNTLTQGIAICVAVTGIALVLIRRYANGGVCHSKVKLTGKTVIITGANTGIGKETAIDLAKRNAKVILACRNLDKGQKAEREIRFKSGSDNVIYRHLDLASLASVRRFAENVLEQEPRIDILINNAGIAACPQWKTEDGFEMQFGVNHLGHFLLTNLLLDKLKEAPSARIINVASSVYKHAKAINFDDLNHEQNYNPYQVYAHSKLANILFTRSLAKRLNGSSVTTNCLNPGLIHTELFRHYLSNIGMIKKTIIYLASLLFVKNPEQGAQTTICCAVSEELEGISGKYFVDCVEKKLETPVSQDDVIAEKLWKVSAELVGLKDN